MKNLSKDDNCEDKNRQMQKQQMLIALVRREISWSDWCNYERAHIFENTELNETLELMDILLSEQVIENIQIEALDNVQQILTRHLSKIKLTELEDSFVSLLESMTNQLTSQNTPLWHKHLMVCWMVNNVLRQYLSFNTKVSLNKKTLNHLCNYLTSLFTKLCTCTHSYESIRQMKTITLAVNILDTILLNDETKSKLRDKLMKLLTFIGLTNRNTDLTSDYFEQIRYQSQFCVEWCLDNNLIDSQNDSQNVASMKVSRDLVSSARNDRNIALCIRSSFAVSSGVYYYEAILLSQGWWNFGWISRESRLLGGMLGFDHYSIGIDSFKRVLHKSKPQNTNQNSYCQVGDVIGCLIDSDNKRFKFYHNGQEISCSYDIHYSSWPYFAAANLSDCQCCFNFGQSDFKYPPKGIRYNTFHNASRKDARKYRLESSVDWPSNHAFKQVIIDNQVDLYCPNDQTQHECNQLVKQIENQIRQDEQIEQINLRKIATEKVRFKSNEIKFENEELKNDIEDLKLSLYLLRYMQSIIETMKTDELKGDLAAMWIGDMIQNIIHSISTEKFHEFIYPYLQLRLSNAQDVLKHRNICIILYNYIKFNECFVIVDIRKKILAYLMQTFLDTCDSWTKLFVLLCLDGLRLTEEEITQIENKHWLIFLIRQLGNSLNNFKLESLEDSLQYQLCFVAHHLIDSFNSDLTRIALQICPDETSNRATLKPVVAGQFNITYKSEHAFYVQDNITKLSPDRLSVRSDWNWQSAQSVYEVNSNIYYFEAHLLTNGPMRIGWATQITNFNKIELGDDEHSIAFDGYNRCVWHEKESYPFNSTIPRWKAGDVVGCLYDRTVRKFSFTLNGDNIEILSSNIYFSKFAYRATVSLSAHQQCLFNFGKTDFKYRPKRIDFLDFHNDELKSLSLNKPEFNISHSQLNNCLISNNSKTQTKNVTMDSSKVVMTRSSLNQNKKSTLEHRRKQRCALSLFKKSPTKLFKFSCCSKVILCRKCASLVKECPHCKRVKQNRKQRISGRQQK